MRHSVSHHQPRHVNERIQDINVFVAIESEKLANQVIKQLKDMQHKGIIRSFDDVINNMNLKYRKDLLEWHKSNSK